MDAPFNILAILAFVGKAAVGGAGAALAALGAANVLLLSLGHAASIGSQSATLSNAALAGGCLGALMAGRRLHTVLRSRTAASPRH